MNQTPRTASGLPPRVAIPTFLVVSVLFLGSLGYFFKVSTEQTGSAFGRNLLQSNAPTSAMGGVDTKAAPFSQAPIAQSGTGPMQGAPLPGAPAGGAPAAGGPPAAVMAEVQVYRARLQRNPNDFEALINLGALELQAGMYGKAAKLFAHAAQLKPDDSDALYGEGTAEQALGRREAAIDAYRRFLRVAPHDVRAKDARAALQTLGA